MLCLKSLRLSLLAFVILIFVSANSVIAEGIYSKADATQMFEMSMSEWNANVMAVQTKGQGKRSEIPQMVSG